MGECSDNRTERKTGGSGATIYIKKLSDTAKLPHAGSAYAAGYDLYADLKEELTILPHTTQKISTGLAMEIPVGYFGAIFARSGLAAKEGLRPANCVGVVDADYRGEVIVALHNDSEETRLVKSGDRIAQLVVMPYLSLQFAEVDQLSETVRAEGGFGSTGKQ